MPEEKPKLNIELVAIGGELIISPISKETIDVLPKFLWGDTSSTFRRYIDRYVDNVVFGDYQCG